MLRSDDLGARPKVVCDASPQLNRDQFGGNPEDADSGAEYVVARYCTAARVRKTVGRLVVEGGREFGLHLNDDLDRPFTPSEVYPLVAQRCIAELRTMETNAELNDADPTTRWRHRSE